MPGDQAGGLERAAAVFPGHPAIIHGRQRFTYRQFYDRSRRLASALKALGIRKGDTVAAMLANTPPMLEAHHGVPMTGAVLNALNTRLDAKAIAFMATKGCGLICLAMEGGMLDRLDSVCFAAPVFFHLCRYYFSAPAA